MSGEVTRLLGVPGRTPLAGTTGAKTEKPEDRGWEHGRQKTKHPRLRFEVSSQFPFSWMESPDLFLPFSKIHSQMEMPEQVTGPWGCGNRCEGQWPGPQAGPGLGWV